MNISVSSVLPNAENWMLKVSMPQLGLHVHKKEKASLGMFGTALGDQHHSHKPSAQFLLGTVSLLTQHGTCLCFVPDTSVLPMKYDSRVLYASVMTSRCIGHGTRLQCLAWCKQSGVLWGCCPITNQDICYPSNSSHDACSQAL